MPVRPLRVGFVGAGRIADLQSLGYRDHDGARIAAVCDADESVARRRAAEWGADAWFTDLRAMLAAASLDAVEILTPHHVHAEQAIAALEAGVSVSLQKPPTHTLAELDRIARAAASGRARIRVFENFMYYPPHVKAKQLIESGAIGNPISIRIKTAAGRLGDGWSVAPSSMAWRMDRTRCGGGPTTFDHGYHCYHMARWLMPAEIERVHAFIHWFRLGEDAVYDGPALISWKYAGDVPRFGSWEVIASVGMRVRSKYYVSDDRMEVHGSEGVIWVNRCTGQLLDEPSVVLYRDGETHAYHDLSTDWAESFRLGAHDFIDALRADRAPAQSLAEARRTLAFAIAATRSADEGREVSIREIEDGAPHG